VGVAVAVGAGLGSSVGEADGLSSNDAVGEVDGPTTPDGETVGTGPRLRATSATMITAAPTDARPKAGLHKP
jgi:hypothetical protein